MKSLLSKYLDVANQIGIYYHLSIIKFEFLQDHLPKIKPYVYHDTRTSRVLRVPLGLVKVRIFTEF
jgi:hypothetical protein